MPLYDRSGKLMPTSELPPELAAELARAAAERDTPEYRDALERELDEFTREFPPKKLDPALADALATFRATRVELGLSLTDVQERSGLERSAVSKLERGESPNPTFNTLAAYAKALGMRLSLRLEPCSVRRNRA